MIKQFLLIRDGVPLLHFDFETSQSNAIQKNDLVAGFVSAIETFTSSFSSTDSVSKTVGFGSSNILIERSETGFIGALITEKTNEKMTKFLVNKLSFVISIFTKKYAYIIKSSNEIDESIFKDFIPYVIGELSETKISENVIPKPAGVAEYPDEMTGDCWRVFMHIDGVRSVKQISNLLGSYEECAPLFSFLAAMNIIII